MTKEPDSALVITESYFEPRRRHIRAERGGLTMPFVDLHRPLQDYADALERAGFLIERIREIPDDDASPRCESQLRWRRLPLFVHVRAEKL